MTGSWRKTADARIFDRSGAVPLPRWRDRVSEAGAHARILSGFGERLPPLASLPCGDGHAVLVFPGLFSSDYLIRRFRRVLAGLGYEVEGWGGGVNFGPTEHSWRIAEQRLAGLSEQSGRPVSLVGHSLGGVLARALAFEHPEQVRQVISVCSPFRLPTAMRLELAYRVLAHRHIDPEILLSRIAEPPPVPTLAIYSRRDGIVAWQSCMDQPGPGRENVAVDGQHATMMSNPQTIRVIADRLARPV